MSQMNMHDKLYCKYELFLKILQDSYKILPIVKFVDKLFYASISDEI